MIGDLKPALVRLVHVYQYCLLANAKLANMYIIQVIGLGQG